MTAGNDGASDAQAAYQEAFESGYVEGFRQARAAALDFLRSKKYGQQLLDEAAAWLEDRS